MNSNLNNGKTIGSFLAAKSSEVRNRQLAALDSKVEQIKSKNKSVLYFIKYWGASNKTNLDKYDYDALLNLFGFLRIVEKHYKISVHLTVIFTDTHVLLNGYEPRVYQEYYKQVRHVLNSFNYDHMLMSEILQSYVTSHQMKDIHELIDSIISQSKLYEVSGYLKERESFGLLKRSAEKHSFRLFGNHIFEELPFDSSEQSAYAYITLNQLEKQYVEKKFSKSVFLTYTSDEEKEFIAPNLLSLQIFSFRSGIRSRPWFSHFNQETH